MNESEKKSIEDRVHKILSDIKLAQGASDLDDDLGEVDFSRCPHCIPKILICFPMTISIL